MAKVFDVTAPSSTITLDAEGRGTVAFTIANASGRPLRGRAAIVPQDPSQKAWLKLVGEPERDFAAAGTQQLSVEVAAPAGTKPGTYTFRVDAISVQNPDEDFAQGPTIAFTVRERKARKPFPWWILIVAAVLLIGGGITLWLLLRGVSVPDLTGMTQDDAKTALVSKKLTLGKVTNKSVTDASTIGKVVSQSPAAGQSVKSGAAVDVQIGSSGVRPPIFKIPPHEIEKVPARPR